MKTNRFTQKQENLENDFQSMRDQIQLPKINPPESSKGALLAELTGSEDSSVEDCRRGGAELEGICDSQEGVLPPSSQKNNTPEELQTENTTPESADIEYVEDDYLNDLVNMLNQEKASHQIQAEKKEVKTDTTEVVFEMHDYYGELKKTSLHHADQDAVYRAQRPVESQAAGNAQGKQITADEKLSKTVEKKDKGNFRTGNLKPAKKGEKDKFGYTDDRIYYSHLIVYCLFFTAHAFFANSLFIFPLFLITTCTLGINKISFLLFPEDGITLRVASVVFASVIVFFFAIDFIAVIIFNISYAPALLLNSADIVSTFILLFLAYLGALWTHATYDYKALLVLSVCFTAMTMLSSWLGRLLVRWLFF